VPIKINALDGRSAIGKIVGFVVRGLQLTNGQAQLTYAFWGSKCISGLIQ